jgi:hypothetical protein
MMKKRKIVKIYAQCAENNRNRKRNELMREPIDNVEDDSEDMKMEDDDDYAKQDNSSNSYSIDSLVDELNPQRSLRKR